MSSQSLNQLEKSLEHSIKNYKYLFCKLEDRHNFDALNSLFMSPKFPSYTEIKPACGACVEKEHFNPKVTSYALKKTLLDLTEQLKHMKKDEKKEKKIEELKNRVNETLEDLMESARSFFAIAQQCSKISKTIKSKVESVKKQLNESLAVDRLAELKEKRADLIKMVLRGKQRSELEEALTQLGESTVLIQKELEWKKSDGGDTLVDDCFPYEIMSFRTIVNKDMKQWALDVERKLNFVNDWDISKKSLVKENQEYLNIMKTKNRIVDTDNLNREMFTKWNFQRLVDMKEELQACCTSDCKLDFTNLMQYEFREGFIYYGFYQNVYDYNGFGYSISDPPEIRGAEKSGCISCDKIINDTNKEIFKVLGKNKQEKLKW